MQGRPAEPQPENPAWTLKKLREVGGREERQRERRDRRVAENEKAKDRDSGGSSSLSERLSTGLQQMLGPFRQGLGALSPEGGENLSVHILL